MSPSGDHGLDSMVLEPRQFSRPGTFHTLEDSIPQKGRLDTKEDVTWHHAEPRLDKLSWDTELLTPHLAAGLRHTHPHIENEPQLDSNDEGYPEGRT